MHIIISVTCVYHLNPTWGVAWRVTFTALTYVHVFVSYTGRLQGCDWTRLCCHLSDTGHVLWDNEVSWSVETVSWVVCYMNWFAVEDPSYSTWGCAIDVVSNCELWSVPAMAETLQMHYFFLQCMHACCKCLSSEPWPLFWSCWQPCAWLREAMRRSWLALIPSKW